MSEARRDLAAAFGCRVVEEPETPEGYKVPLWCDEHDAEWPCPPFLRVEAVVSSASHASGERWTEWGVRRTWGAVGTVAWFQRDRWTASKCAREWPGQLVTRTVTATEWTDA